MSYMRNLDSRHISNTRISSRTKQLLVLVGTILIGMLISASVNALSKSPAAATPVAQEASK